MKLELRTVGLALIGCVLGAGMSFLYLTRSPLLRAIGLVTHTPNNTIALAQCSPENLPKDQGDEIFFVSCGGIY